jgi:hypothetical protein
VRRLAFGGEVPHHQNRRNESDRSEPGWHVQI